MRRAAGIGAVTAGDSLLWRRPDSVCLLLTWSLDHTILETRSLKLSRINVILMLSTALRGKVPLCVERACFPFYLSRTSPLFGELSLVFRVCNHRVRTLGEVLVSGCCCPVCSAFARHQDVYLLLTTCRAPSSDSALKTLLAPA